MTIDLNFFKNGISSILERNPNVSNSDLSRALQANITNFNGHIQIGDLRMHSFKSNGYEGIRRPARKVYVSPYGYWTDVLVSITRVFTGVVFPLPTKNGDLLPDLLQGRRITIFCSLDGPEVEVVSEVGKKSLCARLLGYCAHSCENGR